MAHRFLLPRNVAMRMTCPTLKLYFSLMLLLLVCWCRIACGGPQVLAVDMGADWTKGATRVDGNGVTPRANIVLNDQTNRKSPQCIAFRIGTVVGDDTLRSVECIFAEEARSLEPRFPHQSICSPSLLAGRTVLLENLTEPKQEGHQEGESEGVISASDLGRLTYVTVPQTRRGSAVVRITQGSGTTDTAVEFTVEELIGMILGHMKRSAERSLDGAPVRHLVLVVPTSATLAYRQAVVDAAAVAGLRAIHLVHGSVAAVTQLVHLNTESLFQSDSPTNATGAKYAMIYDMGSAKTEVAVFRFTPADTRGDSKTVTLVASVTSHTLGGRSFDYCLARYVEHNLFPAAKPSPVPPILDRKPVTAATRRAVVSLLRTVNAVKERLSANQNVPFVVPGVREDGGDFAGNVSRLQFEEACSGLFDEAVQLRDRAIAQTGGVVRSLNQLARLELIGGATRMPKLQMRLSEGYGKPVDRTLNSDEAVVSGAALMGRESVSRIHIVESLTNDIYFVVSPSINAATGVSNPPPKLLFAKWNTTVPTVRHLAFPNRTTDFTFTLQDKSGRYSNSVAVRGVNESMGAAQQKQQQLSTSNLNQRTKKTVTLGVCEVVVEVMLSRSGLPFVVGSHVRATYMEETTTLPPVMGVGTNQTGVEKGENDNTSQSGSDDAGAVGSGGTNEGGSTQYPGGTDGTDAQAPTAQGSGESMYAANDVGAEGDDRKMGAEQGGIAKTRHFALRFPLQIASVPSPFGQGGVNMNREEALVARDRLRALQRLSDERMMRSALLNDIESLILHYKGLDAWTVEKDNDNSSDWRDIVKKASQWFDDVSDDANVTELQGQLERLKALQVA